MCSEAELEAYEVLASLPGPTAAQVTHAAGALLDFAEDHLPNGTRRRNWPSDRQLAADLDGFAFDLRQGRHEAAVKLAEVLARMAETRKPKLEAARELPF